MKKISFLGTLFLLLFFSVALAVDRTGVPGAPPGPSGLSDDGNGGINVEGNGTFTGSVSVGTTTVTASGPTDNVDVTNVCIVKVDTSSNNVTIGGFVGGRDGQSISVYVIDATNNCTIENAESTGNQDIYLESGGDETKTASYGGWVLTCDGSNWYQTGGSRDTTGLGGDQLVDVVVTSPLTVNGTTNADNVLPGSDADITFAMPAATNAAAGHATAAHIQAIEANTAKNTNVSTNLSEGTATETTVDVNSSDGSNATLVSASTLRAGLLTKAKFDEIVANTAKVTNTDDQKIDVSELDGTTLKISLESDGEATKEIELSSLQDGTGTDDQNAGEVSCTDEFDNSDATNVQDVLDDLDAAIAGGGTTLKDLVTTSPLSGGTNDILPGADSDVTLSIADAAADGSTKGAASFAANDFDSSSGNISLDYTNAQKADTDHIGFLTDTDWDTFNGKLATNGSAANLTGLTVSGVAAGTLVIESEGISSNDNDTTIPTSAAVKAYADSVGGGSGTLTTIKENDAGVGDADIVTLDFLGADFDLAETPDTEVQVVIAAAIMRDAEWTAATDEAAGKVELSTDAESVTGTSDSVVVTPGTLTARLAAPGEVGGDTPGPGHFTTLSTTSGVTTAGTDSGGQFFSLLEDTDNGAHYSGWGVYGDIVASYLLAPPLAVSAGGQVMAFAAPGNQTMSDGTEKSVSVGTWITPLVAADVDTWAELPALAENSVLVGNGSNQAAAVALDDTPEDSSAKPASSKAVYDERAAGVTLTNKTIDGDDNTLSDIGYGSIKSTSRSGSDETLITGTKGTNTYAAVWDANGDLVDGPGVPLIAADVDTWAELPALTENYVLLGNGSNQATATDASGWDKTSSDDITTADMPTAGTDPDVDAAGEIGRDTDDHSLRGYDGSAQFAYGMKNQPIHVTVVSPNDLADGTRDAFLFWENTSGMSFIVTSWNAKSGTDDTTLNIEETDGDGANNATVDAVEIATDGTGLYYASDSTITAATIENGHMLWLDFDDTDEPTWVKITINGYYNADVD